MKKNLLESREHIFYGGLLPLLGALLAVALAAAVARPRRPRAAALCLWLPFALPGALLSFGIIRLWNVPLLDGVYNSPLLLVVGTAARFLPLAYFALAAHLRSVPADYWEAGRLLGGGWRGGFRRLARVRAPLAVPGLVLGTVTVFLLQSGELPATLQLQHPGLTPITVAIYNKLHLYREQDVAAHSLYHVAAVQVITSVVILCGRLAGTRS